MYIKLCKINRSIKYTYSGALQANRARKASMGSLENQSFGNGFLHPTETNGKVITCKGTCKYTRNLQFYASLSRYLRQFR